MRAARWAVIVAAACLVVAVVAVAYAAGTAKAAPVLRAQRFELVDEDGRVWASLGFEGRPPSADGSPSTPGVPEPLPPPPQVGLRLFDGEGEVRASLLLWGERGRPELSLQDAEEGKAEVNLSVLGTGPQVLVTGTDGAAQACLDVKKGSQPGLALYGKDGKTGVVIMTGAMGALVGIRDETGDPRLGLATSADGQSDLFLHGAGTDAGAELVTRADGSVAMVLQDARKRARVAMRLSKEGAPKLGRSSAGTAQDGTVEQGAESSLVLFDRNGKTLWQAP